MKKNILFLIFGCVISFTCMALMPLSVFAANDCVSTEKGNKSYYNYGTNSFYDRIVEKNTQTAADIFAGEVSMQKFLVDKSAKILNDSNRCHVPIPNTVMDGTTSESPRMSCWDWFLGNDKAKWEGITFNPNHMNGNANCENSPDQVGSYLESLGYTAEKNPSGGLSGGQKQGCITGYVSENPPDGGAPKRVNISNQLCFYLYEEGGKQYIDLWATDNNGWAIGDDNAENYLFDWCSTDSGYCAFDNAGEGNIVFYIKNSGGPTGYLDKGAIALGIDELVTFDGFVSEWQDGLSRWNNEATNDYKIQGEIKGGSNDSDDGLVATYNSVYKKGAKADIAAGILGTKSNPYLGKPTPRGFTSAEVYNTYLEYLSDKNHVTFLCSEDHDFENDNNYKWFHLDNVKYQDKFRNDCWVQGDGMRYTGAEIGLSSTRDPNTGAITNTEYYFTKENMTLEQIVKQMNSLRKNLSDDEIGKLGDNVANVTDSGEDGETEPTCANSGGAASLGWIVCPILDWMQEASTDAYNNYVKPNLMVQPTLFQGEGDETRSAWGIFQGFANVCFIILFLVVIFSQLTGVGIDNYGIKKILPKMIIVAILVNLSYLICILCVDLSNILGNAFQALFEGLSVGGSATVGEKTFEGSGAGATVITAVALVSALFLVGKTVWQNPAILLTLLVSALGVLIAVFFLFILLAGRKAAIVVLTVISPLAFVSYALPNLKRQFFDKWLKFWEGLLLVYPICGLLIGGGDFVSRLLLVTLSGGDGFLGAFTAMIVGIIPVFMIPTVLKGAFAAMGTIGSKITGFGDRARSRVTSGTRNSDIYKNMQERGRETGIRRKAGYDKNGNKKDLNRFQRFIRGGRRNVQRNALAYQKLQSEKGALAATEGKDFMLETETANEMKDIVSSGDINDINKLQTGLQGALLANDRAKIRAYSDALFSKKEEGNKSAKAAYNAAVGAGADPEAMRTWANNVMQNHAGLKKDHGSLFAAAQGIVSGGAAQSTGDYLSTADPTTGLTGQAALAGKVSKASIGSMDDASFEEIFGGYNSNSPVSIPTGADAQAIGETAYNAIRENPDMNSKRLGYLRQLVTASGYSPDTQTVQFGAGSQEMNALNQTAASTERTANGVDAVNTQLQQMHRLSGAQLDAKMAQLDDQTIGEIASDPQLSNNDPIVQAAQREYTRRDRERGPQFNP